MTDGPRRRRRVGFAGGGGDVDLGRSGRLFRSLDIGASPSTFRAGTLAIPPGMCHPDDDRNVNATQVASGGPDLAGLRLGARVHARGPLNH